MPFWQRAATFLAFIVVAAVIVFAGRHDVDVNTTLAHDWFEKVQAPSKQFVWFENSSHLPMTEEPGKFLVSLVRYARPIAENAGDTAPGVR